MCPFHRFTWIRPLSMFVQTQFLLWPSTRYSPPSSSQMFHEVDPPNLVSCQAKLVLPLMQGTRLHYTADLLAPIDLTSFVLRFFIGSGVNQLDCRNLYYFTKLGISTMQVPCP